jgi:histidine kinase
MSTRSRKELYSFETITCEYKGKKSEGIDQPVFLQSLKASNPSLDDLVYLKNDFDLSQNKEVNGILRAIKMVHDNGVFVIYKEYFEGIPLVAFLESWTFNAPQFISLAIKLTKLLQDLHGHNILVKEFIIENILIDPESQEVKLCSLGSASEISRERVEYSSEFNYYGSLYHIAPEQTGRIGRTVDHRTDFYALGIIFYQILCRQKPFFYTDSLELIHAHIAKTPVQPKSIVNSVPDPFNAIVLKLMSKNAEDRYQSEAGILYDLDRCMKEWQQEGRLDSFQLGEEDFSSSFYISEKLYGRGKEIKSLLQSWQSVQQQSTHLYLVGGFSGIGKTRLINEIRKSVIESNGLFLSGKYDQLNKENAFSGFIQITKDLVQNILSGTDLQIDEWKETIRQQTDSDIAILFSFVPELKLLIDDTVEFIDIGPVEGKKKLNKAAIDLMSIYEAHNKPAVLFLDDLQWADMASLEMIHTIIGSGIKNVLLIGAYRDNEVDDTHPLTHTIEQITKDKPDGITSVFLKDLTRDDINHLVADSFQMSPNATIGLTDTIMKKTRGNPFFVKQMLQQLVDENAIHFDSDVRSWIWDLRSLQDLELSDYAVDLILKRMNQLSESARQVISLAACIGNTFDFNTLSRITGKETSELSETLWELKRQEFINSIGQWGKHHSDDIWNDIPALQKTNHEFRFQHDRIQQAAYSIIPEENLKQKHYAIGCLLLSQMSEHELHEKLFDVLNHFLIGQDHIVTKAERLDLAQLSLKAAKRAYRNNVIRPATVYFNFGMKLIDEDQSVDIFKDLLIGHSECEYLLGNYEVSEELFDRAVSNARTPLNKADILCRKMALYENTQRHALAIDTAREGLRHLGINLPKKVNQFHVMKELLTVKFLLRNKTTDQLLNNKKMESPEKILIMKTLMNLWGPAYLLQKQELLAFKILRMVNYSVRFGNSIESALAYSFYGYVVSAQLKDYKSGYDFAQLGIALNQKLNDKSLRSKVMVIAEGCVAHWKRPYTSIIPTLREGFHVGVESNDIIYAGYASTFMNRNNFLSGENLHSVQNKSIGFFHFVKKVNAIISREQMLPWARLIKDLMGVPPHPDIFDELGDEDIYYQHITKLNDELNLQLPLANYYTTKSMYHFIMNRPDLAFDYAKKADPLMSSVMGLSEWSEQIVYKTLAGLALLQKNQKLSRSDRKAISGNLKTMKAWAESGPDNYEAKYFLALALQADVNKKPAEAAGYFQKAIDSAAKNNMVNLSSLAYERFAYFKVQQNLEDQSIVLFRKSIIDYHEWGAARKVEQLKELIKSRDNTSGKTNLKVDISSKKLDMETILQASQTLSGEVRTDRLMEKLLLILIQNAGAQNAYLIQHKKDRFVIEASSRMEDDNVMKLRQTPISDVSEILQSLVRKTYQTGKAQILNDVMNSNELAPEALERIMARSIMCLPIKSKSEIKALLYLDNHLSSHVFTDERLELMQLLSGQIAISLENAELYQNLENRVLERTQVIEQQKLDLEKSKKQSDDLLLNILPSEVADELKENGSSKTRQFSSVTIMFTDFEEFTKMTESLSPEDLVAIVDHHYKAFDTIVEKYGVEKIKTIGDAYMCASGLPVENPDHALNAVRAALEMSKFVQEHIKERKAKNLPYCRMRIGLHTGPVIAGVVGFKKFAYDIWGDSVNTAARMESNCEVDRINISRTTYELVKEHFKCSYRGKINVKNKGEIEMYYVDGVLK